MLARTTPFPYSINAGYPEGYYVIYDRGHSYFMNNRGKPLIRFDGRIGAGGGWGAAHAVIRKKHHAHCA